LVQGCHQVSISAQSRYIVFAMPCFRSAAVLMAAVCALSAATEPRDTVYEDQPGLLLGNDKIQLTVLTQGATIASLTLADDDEQVNPLWNPFRLA
jgi:hypothetical protein